MMLELLLTVVPSACWLLYRCFQLLKTPIEEIVEELNINIPFIPTICVDAITNDSVVIHWDIQTRIEENLIFLLLVNKKEVATVSSTSCKFNDLLEDKLYQIQVIAINPITNFRSQSAAIFIETLPQGDGLDELEVFEQEGNPVTKCDAEDIDLSRVSSDEIKMMDDENVLNKYLNYFQCQFKMVKNEFIQYTQSNVEEINHLQTQLKHLQTVYEEKVNGQHKKIAVVKDYQKIKEDLLHQKTKLVHQLENVKNFVNTNETDLQNLYDELDNLKLRKLQLEDNFDTEEYQIQHEINGIKLEINTLKQTNSEKDDLLKSFKSRKKQVTKTLDSLKVLVDDFNDSCFNKDHSINQKGLDILDSLFTVMPQWQQEILQEVNKLNEFNNAWRMSFRNELKNYVNVQHNLETLKTSLDPNYTPNYYNEYNASIQFGGYNNALPKMKKRFRSHSQPKTLDSHFIQSPGVSVQSPGLSVNPLGTDYNPLQPTTSPLGYSGLSGTISQPQSQAQPQPQPQTVVNPSNTSAPPSVNVIPDTFNNYFGDIYTQQDDFTNYATPPFDSPIQENATLNPMLSAPKVTSSPNLINQDFVGGNLPVNNGPVNNGPVNNANTMWSGDEDFINPSLMNFNYNQSTSSLNRYPNLWNDSVTHTRSVSGPNSHLWSNDFTPNQHLEPEFKPFDNGNFLNPLNLSTLPNIFSPLDSPPTLNNGLSPRIQSHPSMILPNLQSQVQNPQVNPSQSGNLTTPPSNVYLLDQTLDDDDSK